MVSKMEIQVIIGGSFQGKLRYAKSLFSEEIRIVDGRNCDLNFFCGDNCFDLQQYPVVFYSFHSYIGRMLKEKNDPIEEIRAFLQSSSIKQKGLLVIICDEVGYGVIPMDPMESLYREAVGRCLCLFTPIASRVDRIIAGIPMQIKPCREDQG